MYTCVFYFVFFVYLFRPVLSTFFIRDHSIRNVVIYLAILSSKPLSRILAIFWTNKLSMAMIGNLWWIWLIVWASILIFCGIVAFSFYISQKRLQELKRALEEHQRNYGATAQAEQVEAGQAAPAATVSSVQTSDGRVIDIQEANNASIQWSSSAPTGSQQAQLHPTVVIFQTLKFKVKFSNFSFWCQIIQLFTKISSSGDGSKFAAAEFSASKFAMVGSCFTSQYFRSNAKRSWIMKKYENILQIVIRFNPSLRRLKFERFIYHFLI